MHQIKLRPQPFLQLASSLASIPEPTEIVFENDNRGHLIGVQAFGDSEAVPVVQRKNLSSDDGFIVELALAIEDRAGSDELRLARALLVYARAAKPDRRVAMAEHLEHLAKLWL